MIAVTKGPKLIFELANPLYLKVVGKTKSIIGKPLLKVFPELKGQEILKILKNVYKTGKPFMGKEVLVKLDRNNIGKSEDIYFNFVYQPFRDAQGAVGGIMTHAVEVTENIQARKKLEESEARFRTLAEHIPTLTWMARPDGHIYWYNPRWYEYTGTTLQEMEGWGWQKVHHPKELPKVMEQWKNSIKTGEPFEMVFPLRGADGIFRPFLTRITPLRDRKNNVVQWFGTNTDITKQKELERQKDDFLGIASHELKTPVTSIKAYGQVLQAMFARKGDKMAVDQLKKMDAQINKLTNLIEDLLDVTKIQSGRLEFHEEYFDFNELVDEIVEELQLTTQKHTLIKKFGAAKRIYADRERIGQVLINLITNAIKYSPHNKKIVITTDAEKNTVILCVKDFGVGIPKNKQGKVFEQFFRVSGPNQSTFPGLGLGLYVSSEIIKREGGRIWVESIEGKGSTFCFSIPIKKRRIAQRKNRLSDEEIKHE